MLKLKIQQIHTSRGQHLSQDRQVWKKEFHCSTHLRNTEGTSKLEQALVKRGLRTLSTLRCTGSLQVLMNSIWCSFSLISGLASGPVVLKLLSGNTLQKQTTEQILSKEKLAGFFKCLFFSHGHIPLTLKQIPRQRHVCADQHICADHEDDRISTSRHQTTASDMSNSLPGLVKGKQQSKERTNG